MREIKLPTSTSTLLLLNILILIATLITNITYPLSLATNTLYITTILISLWLPNIRYIINFSIFSIYWTLYNKLFLLEDLIINNAIIIFTILITSIISIYYKRTIAFIENNEKRQRYILDTTIEQIITVDKNQMIQSANKSIESTFGWPIKDLIGKNFYTLLAEPFATQYKKHLEDLSYLHQEKNPLSITSELLAQHKENYNFPCEISIAKINDDNNYFFIITIRDISERKQFEEKLIWLSTHDELTGIFNRRYFNRQINLEWNRLIRSNLPLSLIILDIDYFKKYNDTLGHQAGDLCLKKIATIINNSINRAGDFAARYGGEEFVLLMPNTSKNGVAHIAKKIQTEIENINIEHPYPGSRGHITVSMGASIMFPIKACSSDVLIKQADNALYQAKNSGKNCYKLYGEE